jgi:hypothetical protein
MLILKGLKIMEIKIKVVGQTMTFAEDFSKLVSGSHEIVKLSFAFDSEWEGFTKIIYFRYGTLPSISIPLSTADSSVVVPYRVIFAPGFSLYLRGISGTKIITAFRISIPVTDSGMEEVGGESPIYHISSESLDVEKNDDSATIEIPADIQKELADLKDFDDENAKAQIKKNTADIAAETERAKASEKANVDAISSEISDRVSADSTISSNLLAEADRAKTSEKANSDSIAAETANRQNGDVGLQTQIDAVNATQNVIDIVSTKAALDAYIVTNVHAKDKIEVLTDETQESADTIYNWTGSAWSLVGKKLAYYSKAETDNKLNTETNRATASENANKASITQETADRKSGDASAIATSEKFTSDGYIPKVSSAVANNLPKLNSDGTLADSGISAYNVINRVHWTIIATGSDPAVKLGGDATGLTDEQLMQLYPFNDTRIETVQLYGSDKATKLAGEDKFLSMPNAYYYFESTGTDGSFVFHMSNCKVDENYKKMVDYPYISRLLLAKYKANDDGTYLRSESGAEPAHSMTLTTAIGKLPYAKTDTDKFRRLDVGDKRARAMFFWMAMAKLNTRDFQSKYRGMVSYSYNNGDWTIIPDKLRLNGSTDVLGNGLITGEISSYVDDSSVTQAIAVNCRPFEILGVENPYGFIWEQIYGLYSKDREIYSYDGLDELTADQCNPGSANFAASDTGKQLPNTNGWQSTVDIVGAYQVPTAVTGSEGKYDSDYYWYASGNQLALVGGGWCDGGYAGLSSLNVYYAFARANSAVGFRLSLLI